MTILHALLSMGFSVGFGMLAGFGIGVAVHRPHRDAKGRFSRPMPEQTREGDR